MAAATLRTGMAGMFGRVVGEHHVHGFEYGEALLDPLEQAAGSCSCSCRRSRRDIHIDLRSLFLAFGFGITHQAPALHKGQHQ